ncbi:MAG: hypothetical protein KHY73_00595 [Fusobacterium nucleatum]|nr:hypothetical protein [Fusobacterium nucleatum]
MALRTLKNKKQTTTATSKSEFVAQAPLTVKQTTNTNKKVIKSIYFTQDELDLIENFKANTSISRNKLGSEAIRNCMKHNGDVTMIRSPKGEYIMRVITLDPNLNSYIKELANELHERESTLIKMLMLGYIQDYQS